MQFKPVFGYGTVSVMSQTIKVAIAHDYLTQRGGAEKVVLAMARAFPGSPIYTTLYDPEGTYPEFAGLDVRSAPLNKIQFFRKNHRAALPVLPLVASTIKIDADVVVASSSGWAHGFRTDGEKIVYCYSPARWLYQQEAYLGKTSAKWLHAAMAVLTRPLKRWDRYAAGSASSYIAISSVVQKRIHDCYGISSPVVPSPHTFDVSKPDEKIVALADWADRPQNESFYLCISRLLPYKNVDKVISAFDGTNPRLVVVGTGPERETLEALKPSNVRLLSNLTDGQMRWLYGQCRALVAASYEDFGLTPLEAACYGKPSVALRWGGFLDTINENITGVYFDRPEPADILKAIEDLESRNWNAEQIACDVERFNEAKFHNALHASVTNAYYSRHAPDGSRLN